MVVDLVKNEGYSDMGKYVGPVCRLCRREGAKLFLKGSRCHTKSCSFEKRDTPPGMHKWKRGKVSEYGQRLREKQKVKRYYGVYETQFINTFREAERQQGNTGENLLRLLERRLDNVVCKANFAASTSQARQLIVHGHIRVNGRKLTIPSYLIREGDVIEPMDKEKSKKLIKECLESSSDNAPSWLEMSKEAATAKVVQMPTRDEIGIEVKEQMIVEFCSR